MSDHPIELEVDDSIIAGTGTFNPPPDLTVEDCERLAAEADEERNQ